MQKLGPILEEHRPGCTFGHPTSLPKLDKTSFPGDWIPTIKKDFAACQMPRPWQARAAMLYLPDNIRQLMINKRDNVWEQSGIEWILDDFIREVQAYLGQSL